MKPAHPAAGHLHDDDDRAPTIWRNRDDCLAITFMIFCLTNVKVIKDLINVAEQGDFDSKVARNLQQY